SSALLWIQLKTRVANSGVGFAHNHLASHILSLTHQVTLLRSHLHPKLGVASEILAGIRWHREPAFPYALGWRWPMRLAHWHRAMGLGHWRWPMRCRHWGRTANRRARLLSL